jgi:hypothetical protein
MAFTLVRKSLVFMVLAFGVRFVFAAECPYELLAEMGTVKETHSVVSFGQKLVAAKSLPDLVRKAVFDAVTRSGAKDNFTEIGFFVYHFKDGHIVVGRFYSSGRETKILDKDSFEVLRAELSRLDPASVARIEHYHTHPLIDQYGLSLSDADITSALKVHKFLITKGVEGGFSENAIHSESKYGTEQGTVARIDLSPRETKDARDRIAAHLQSRLNTKREEIPENPPGTVVESANGNWLLLPTDRRQKIGRAIDATAQIEDLQKMSFNKAIEARVKRVSQLGIANPTEVGDQIWGYGSNRTYAISRLAGIEGETPNEMKTWGDVHFQWLLSHSRKLPKPSNNCLVVYRKNGDPVAAGIYLGKDASGAHRVRSRWVGNLPAIYEHNLEDVPESFGDTVEFYLLPSNLQSLMPN